MVSKPYILIFTVFTMLGTKKNRWLYILVVLIGIAVFWIIANSKPAPVAKAIRVPPVPFVDVLRIQPGHNQVWIETQGVVQPKTKIELIAQVSGRVIAVDNQFVAGGAFDAEQALVKIEQDDYRIAISQAKATLADAKQLLATEKGRARQAKREWRDLANKEANELFLRKPQLASAEAGADAAEANLQKAQLDLARTQITVPFAGRVLTKNVDLGQFIAQGSLIAEVYSTDIAEVRLPLTARQRQMVRLPSADTGIPVKLLARYGDEQYQWPATLDRLEGAVDSESRQYYVVASISQPFDSKPVDEVSNNKPALSVGQFVTAQIGGAFIENSFVIPRTALRQQQQVWLMQNKQLRLVSVDVIQSNDDSSLVKLKAGADIDGEFALIVSPLSLALDGMTVRERGGSERLSGTNAKQVEVNADIAAETAVETIAESENIKTNDESSLKTPAAPADKAG